MREVQRREHRILHQSLEILSGNFLSDIAEDGKADIRVGGSSRGRKRRGQLGQPGEELISVAGRECAAWWILLQRERRESHLVEIVERDFVGEFS